MTTLQTQLIQSDSGVWTVFYVKRHIRCCQMLMYYSHSFSWFMKDRFGQMLLRSSSNWGMWKYIFVFKRTPISVLLHACCLAFFSLVLPLFIHLSISPHSPGGFDCSLAPCEEEQMQTETPSHKHMQTDISSRAHN